MKIYFSGSASVGKSTLANYVSKHYNLSLVFEQARIVLSEQELRIDTLRCDLDIADTYQQDVFNRQLAEEQKYTSFVSDRSLIDILAYSGQYTRILPKLMQSSELTTYVANLKQSGSIIFFVKPHKTLLHQDGVREILNWENVIAIDANIKLLYEMFDINYIQIDTVNMQERIKMINTALSLAKS